ncbi:hypothetical protein B0O80DRAFT_490890 [Mortierella sp. GBAus27b]|nr:hypothetical protein B0O80DRAFT_490890 [Mortierella sp. GBAus27b]
MIGRSLFSVFAIAAVAIQTCVADVVPNGAYLIKHGPIPVGTRGNQVVLAFQYSENFKWVVENTGCDTVFIRNIDMGGQYMRPVQKSEGAPVEVHPEPFRWRLIKQGNEVAIEPAERDLTQTLVFSPVRDDILGLAVFKRDDSIQTWSFEPVK